MPAGVVHRDRQGATMALRCRQHLGGQLFSGPTVMPLLGGLAAK
jgi:hypothetical protein